MSSPSEDNKYSPSRDFGPFKGNRVEINTRHFPDGCTPHAKGIVIYLKDNVEWSPDVFDPILNNKSLDNFSFWTINFFIKDKQYTFTKEFDETVWEEQLSDIAKFALARDDIFKAI